jgi:DNA-binding NarL/FixJ family response regulator
VSDAVRERLPQLGGASDDARESPIQRLTDRELEVFLLLGRGFAPRHIAEQLSLSVKIIETYRRHLKQKLDVDDSAELTRYAVAWRVERSATGT